MRFIFRNIYDEDDRPRVLVVPSPGSTPSVRMYRLDDETIEWSHNWAINACEELDCVLDTYAQLIESRWRERAECYTLDTPIPIETE